MLNDAINRAKNTYQQAKAQEQEKRKQRPITKSGFIQYFYELYEKHDYGTPPPITKDTINKVSGLIRVLKSNGYESKDFYELLDKLFEKWYELKSRDIKTNNKKQYILDDKPNLMDLINCRNQILQVLEEGVKEGTEEKTLFELWEED